MTTRAQIVDCARSWLGTPWQHQQRAKGLAVDCAGLIIGVARELGLVDAEFDVNGYGRRPSGELIDLCAHYLDPVAQADLQPGDVVVVSIYREPQHMGIAADYAHGGLSLIHAASKPVPQVIETRLMFRRSLRFEAGFAFAGLS